jgi:gamma-glutamyltranspeptidase
MGFRHSFGRSPAVASEAMVATSQPRATHAGIGALERGGNAIRAKLAQVKQEHMKHWTALAMP